MRPESPHASQNILKKIFTYPTFCNSTNTCQTQLKKKKKNPLNSKRINSRTTQRRHEQAMWAPRAVLRPGQETTDPLPPPRHPQAASPRGRSRGVTAGSPVRAAQPRGRSRSRRVPPGHPRPRRACAGARKRSAHARSGPALGWSGQLREQRPRPGGSEPSPTPPPPSPRPAALTEPPGPPPQPRPPSRGAPPEPQPAGARGRLRGSDPRPLAPGWDS